MNVVCVGDEQSTVRLVVRICEELPQAPSVVGFTQARGALDWMQGNSADIALLDIDMPDADGLNLARAVKQASPDTAIIFLTDCDQYAVDAFALHASGYLLKPVDRARLAAEIEFALQAKTGKDKAMHVEARTFGNFDLLVGGRPVSFARSKAKELLAYLVDRRGSTVTRPEAFAALWERGNYDRPAQKKIDVIIRSMRETLDENGIGSIVEMERGTLRIVPDLVRCDMYRFFDGDEQAVAAFHGEYMSTYPWARRTEGYMEHMKLKN